MKKTIFFWLCLVVSSIVRSEEYYFIPFGSSTLTPVTKDNISERATFLCKPGLSEINAGGLKEFFLSDDYKSASPDDFDGRNVRLLVRGLFKDDYYVDANGIILIGSGVYELPKYMKDQIYIIIPKTCHDYWRSMYEGLKKRAKGSEAMGVYRISKGQSH